jgi:hypothetical protein
MASMPGTRGHLDIHVHAVVRQQDDQVRFLVADLIDESPAWLSWMPKVQLGMKRCGLAIGV